MERSERANAKRLTVCKIRDCWQRLVQEIEGDAGFRLETSQRNHHHSAHGLFRTDVVQNSLNVCKSLFNSKI